MPRLTENKKLFQKWTDRLEVAKQARKDAGEQNWRRNIDMFNNRHWNMGPLGKDIGAGVVVNLTRSLIGIVKDVTYFQDPRILAEPIPEEVEVSSAEELSEQISPVEDAATLIQAILETLFPRLGIKREVRRAIQDGLLTPCGWVKIYHETETVSSIEGVEKISHEDFAIRRVYPFNMLVDPEADAFDLNRVNWLAEKKLLAVDDAKDAYRDAQGRGVKLEDFKANATAFEDHFRGKRRKPPEQFERMAIWEIHDRSENELIEISEGAGILRHEEEHPYDVTAHRRGFIYDAISLSDEDPNTFYPRPFIESLIPINETINKLVTYKVGHVGRAAKRIISTPKGMYDADDMTVIEEGEDGAIVEHNPEAAESAPFVFPTGEIPADVWQLVSFMMGPVWREVARLDELTRGGVAQGVSPTEAQIIQQGTSIGLAAKRDQVEDHVARIAQILLAEAQQFVDRPQAIKLIGPLGTQWKTWSKDQIAGNFNVRVEAFSTSPLDQNFEKRESVDILNLLYGRPEIDNVELIENVLKKFRIPSRVMRRPLRQGPQDPREEHRLLMQGLPLRVDPTEDHRDHIQQHGIFMEYLQSQNQGTGDEILVGWVNNLSRHLDQHRMMLSGVEQGSQMSNAAQGAVGAPGQPSQDLFANRRLRTSQPSFTSDEVINQQGLAELLGGG